MTHPPTTKAAMITPSTVSMPHLGESITEGTVTRWLKQPGDAVAFDEPLLEVATDKVDTEVPSPVAGVLTEILAGEDDIVEIGGPLAVIAPVGEKAETHGTRFATATQEDECTDLPMTPGLTADGTEDSATCSVPSDVHPPAASADIGTNRVEKLRPIRRTIAARMIESLHTAAQVTTVVEVGIPRIARLRRENKDSFTKRTGHRLSYLPFFAKAAIEALSENPVINSSLDADVTTVTYHHACHLGIAVDSEKGLMVPVIENAQDLTIADLAQTISTIAERVRSGKISADELSGGTFTLTNTGSRGALFDTPIINQPQSAILGTGSVVERLTPVYDSSGNLTIAAVPTVCLSLSYDHRIVDGADAARYLGDVKHRLEQGYTPDDLGDCLNNGGSGLGLTRRAVLGGKDR